jgi:hypothetical protein
VTRRSKDHPDGDRPASTRPVKPGGRRSLAFVAGVLVVAALVGGAGGAGAAGLLTGRNVRDDSLRSADFRDGSIRAGQIRTGGLTAADVGFDLAGDQGDPGDTGAPGFPGILRITYHTGPPRSSTTVGALSVVAVCDAGESSLAGGAQLDASDPGTLPNIMWSMRDNNNGWRTFIASPAGFKQYTPWVVCAQVP